MLNLYDYLKLILFSCLFLFLSIDTKAQCGSSANVIPNPSFETNTCCPTKVVFNPSCISNWICYQNSPDFYSDCGTGTGPTNAEVCCGNAPPYPFPDGGSVVGFVRASAGPMGPVTERVGVCLTTPLTTGNSYTFTMSTANANFGPTAFKYVVYGTTNCANFSPVITPFARDLPATFTLLATNTVMTSNTSWTTTSVTFTAPSAISGILIGADSTANLAYYYADSLSLAETSSCPSGGSGSTWTWTGCVDTDWFNACNWDRLSVPNTTSNVIIPFTANQPLITAGTANCFDITVQSSTGAVITINSTGGGSLNVVKP